MAKAAPSLRSYPRSNFGTSFTSLISQSHQQLNYRGLDLKMLSSNSPHVQVSTSLLLPTALPIIHPRMLSRRCPPPPQAITEETFEGGLQGIGEQFVHLCDARGDAKVDCAVADLDD